MESELTLDANLGEVAPRIAKLDRRWLLTRGVTLALAIEKAEEFGAKVEFRDVPEEPGRYFGILAGHTIVLYRGNSEFDTLFTIAHLFGHLTQRLRPTEEMYRAIGIVNPNRGIGPLSPEDLDLMFRHEFEAAQLGLALLDEVGPVSTSLYDAYVHMFWTDFHYLKAYVETGVGGPDAFQAQWERETCDTPIPADRNIGPVFGDPDAFAPDIMVV